MAERVVGALVATEVGRQYGMQQRARLTLHERHVVQGTDGPRRHDPGPLEVADPPVKPLLLQAVRAGCIAQPRPAEAVRAGGTERHEFHRPRIGGAHGMWEQAVQGEPEQPRDR